MKQNSEAECINDDFDKKHSPLNRLLGLVRSACPRELRCMQHFHGLAGLSGFVTVYSCLESRLIRLQSVNLQLRIVMTRWPGPEIKCT